MVRGTYEDDMHPEVLRPSLRGNHYLTGMSHIGIMDMVIDITGGIDIGIILLMTGVISNKIFKDACKDGCDNV